MPRTLATLGPAALGAALWLLWSYEHERTGIRAPWTGLTLVASALAFAATGVAGRGWRAVALAALGGVAAVLLADPLVWEDPVLEPVPAGGECDPGCISPAAGAVMAGVVAAALATLGILLRRAAGIVARGRRPGVRRA